MLFNAKSSPHGKTKRQNRRAAHMERQRAPPKGREAKNGSRGIDSRGRIPERLCRCNGRYAQKKEQRRQREQAKKARRWYFIKQKACGLAMLAITVLAVWATEGDITIAFITVPLGLTCIVVCDEMAAWSGDAGLKQYEVMKSALGARTQPMILSICHTARRP